MSLLPLPLPLPPASRFVVDLLGSMYCTYFYFRFPRGQRSVPFPSRDLTSLMLKIMLGSNEMAHVRLSSPFVPAAVLAATSLASPKIRGAGIRHMLVDESESSEQIETAQHPLLRSPTLESNRLCPKPTRASRGLPLRYLPRCVLPLLQVSGTCAGRY